MNTTDIMKDPFFAPILFEIERRILGSVRSAKADGIDMNDSQIPDSSPRDKLLAALHTDLVKMRAGFMSEDSEGNREPLPTKAWTLCIRTIEDSIQRYSTGPGSRGYQNFLESFIAKGSR